MKQLMKLSTEGKSLKMELPMKWLPLNGPRFEAAAGHSRHSAASVWAFWWDGFYLVKWCLNGDLMVILLSFSWQYTWDNMEKR